MKIFLTDKSFVPPIGTFEFSPLTQENAAHCIRIGVRLENLVSCIKDDIVQFKLATSLNTTVPTFFHTWTGEMYKNWDWDKDVADNLFGLRIIMPADRIILCNLVDPDKNKFKFTMCSFFGGPFPNEIAMYIFECWKHSNRDVKDIKKFMQIIFNNIMKIDEGFNKAKENFSVSDNASSEEIIEKLDEITEELDKSNKEIEKLQGRE